MIKPWPYHVILAAAIALSPASLRAEENSHPTAKALIAVLESHASTFDKAWACQQLTALADKESVPALAALLGDEKLAGHARSALESIADTSASAALREALGRVQGKLLAGVVNSLGVRRDVEAVPALKKLAADRASGASSEAMMALGRIASPDAVDALRLALTGDSAESRAAAAAASLTCAERLVAQGKRPEAIAMLEQVRAADVPKHVRAAAVYGMILARQPGDLSLFTAQLQSEDPDLFAVALRAARHLPGVEVTRALAAGLDRLPPARQALVIGALADRKDAAAIAAVQKAAATGPSEGRRVALRALGRVGDAASTPMLIRAALSDDAGMAEAARESLMVSAAQGVDAAIIARLEQATPKDRILLLEILGQRGEASVAVVAKLADDPEADVRRAAVGALGRTVGQENLHLLTSRLQTAKTPEETAAVQQALRAACSRATDPDAYARKLRDCMPAAPLSGKCFLLELIGQVGGREALAIVGGHARDSRPEIQDAAARVLGRWMSVEAAPVLLDLAKTLPDATRRSGCLRGYLRIARQLDLPIDQRLAMCEEAFQVAQRDEERRLAVQVAEIVVKKNVGSAAQRARAKAIGANRSTSLFDGRTLDGWEGDLKVWRVRDGLIVGGSLEGNPQNEFLTTKKSYGDFVLRLEYKLVGTEGFINSGVQFNSVRLKKPANEMYGFQADIGAGHSGCLYDESRRNKFLARATNEQIKRLEKPGDWNKYEVRCAGAHIQIVLNGEKTVDYIEADPAVPHSGLIGLQMHGGCKAEVSFRNITLEELSYAAANRWFGIGKSKWKVVSFSSENTQGEDERAVLAIDDDPATFWHTQWNGAQPGHPHHLAVDMGEQAEISGFTYLPRQDGRQTAGVIGEYEFYLSHDGKQWGQPVAHGRFENIDSDPRGRVVLLSKPAAGRYFKIVSLSAPGSQPYAGAAEIGVLGVTCITASAGKSDTSARQRILMDADWRFHLADDGLLTNRVFITDWRCKRDVLSDQITNDWRWKADEPKFQTEAAIMAAPGLDVSGGDWRDAKSGDDTFPNQRAFYWFRTTLPDVPGPGRTIHFDAVHDTATVYLNGEKVGEHVGWAMPFDVSLDRAWKTGGTNVLAVVVGSASGSGRDNGGITEPVWVGTRVALIKGAPQETDFDDSGWRTVHLPHDFVIEQPYNRLATPSHGLLPVPTAWYRKTFTLPESDKGKDLWIDFDGIFRDATIYLNGEKLGEHPSGYASFRYHITKEAHYGGANVLAVYVNPRDFEGWWYEGGGICRHVWLNVADPLHVAPWGTHVTAELPEPKPGQEPAPATVTIATTLTNSGPVAMCGLRSVVIDDRGEIVGDMLTPVNVSGNENKTVTQVVTVVHPHLWSLETPRLYHVRQTVEQGRRTLDTAEATFGIRTIRFDKDSGFYLNGKPVKLQGVCNHQDFIGVGIGIPDSLDFWRVRKMKEMGANAWRMSHHPPNPALLDACDRLGILVVDENRHLGDDHVYNARPWSTATNLCDLASLIQRDRNHPSIIMWSMFNEEPNQGTQDGVRIFKAMMNVVHKYDATRPISGAMNMSWFDPGIRTVEDLLGVNYSPEVYDPLHKKYPGMPIYASETASTCTARGVYADDGARGWASSYWMTDGSWKPVAERSFVAGSFVWTGFDYVGEASWPNVCCSFGIVDRCGFPKDNYYYYQSWWKTNPIVHLMPHWNWPGKEGQPIRVVVFSNCKRVELFLNGESLGAKEPPRWEHLEWKVKYEPGTLSAKGYDANGKVTAATVVETTGAPAAIRLYVDRNTIVADGEDVLPVEVDILDAQGRIVPTAGNLVTFSVQGAGFVAGVGNGNPSDHGPDQASARHAFNGRCMVLIRAGGQPGRIELTASSVGLKNASLQLGAVGEK